MTYDEAEAAWLKEAYEPGDHISVQDEILFALQYIARSLDALREGTQ